ncbi:ankyrin repeat and MYND domain-containing protein 1 isoform X1 [Hypanus sabinus]|uniref:ankyrin repeat and MYND domain-containing protein 1 isoform X1 n=1 Tax=Hypanus sabinus TaxID=79690 RepID=UPI0028C4B2A6|nr:ankyrin repeat and MYND domain-containing protein 1 isoform X1 [Hypanus sabinus]
MATSDPLPSRGIVNTPALSSQSSNIDLPLVSAVPSSLEVRPPPEVGVQEWPDGWRYQGELQGNLRHGEGRFEWSNGEFFCVLRLQYYVGQFYKDHRHGSGCYFWPDGTKFTGMFYLDRKEGYGTLEMKDGSTFQGLYKGDERFGPGVLTYPNGRQDVGLWYQNRLIKLCTTIEGAFTVKDHPFYQSDMGKHVITIKPYKEKYSWRTELVEDPFSYPYRKLLSDDSYSLPPEIWTYSNDTDHLPLTRSYRREGDRYFFPEEELVDEEQTETLTVINKTPLLVKMQMHIHRHRHAQTELPWDVAAVINGNREGFGPKGPLECSSEQLIIAAGEGDYHVVHEILKNDLVSADVAELHGHTALIGASIACRSDIVNLLLDNGSNVNKLNDEGVSALNGSQALYYPVGCFKWKGVTANVDTKKFNYTAARSSSRKNFQKESTGGLTEEVKRAKKLSIYDRKIRLGSIILHKTPVTSSGKNEESGEEESVTSEVDVSSERLQSPSAGSPSSGSSDSETSDRNYLISVADQQLRRAAYALSRNDKFRELSSQRSGGTEVENVRRIAQVKWEHQSRRRIIHLLLRRGADVNASVHPMPSIFFSLLAADISAMKAILEVGADPNVRLQTMMGGMNGLLPLHIAATLPGKTGVTITELLLKAGADPDLGAEDKDEVSERDQQPDPETLTGFLVKSSNRSGIPKHYYSPIETPAEADGKTALYMASEREDSYKHAHQIVHQLLKHKANPNLLWRGHSPLSLAIASGNDLVVDELLARGADPNLPLTHGLGNALSVALSTEYEDKRSLQGRVALVTKLIAAKANILMPITIQHKGNKAVGTALDYAHYKYYQDRRIAETPYHALSPEEREVCNARRFLLNSLGKPFRTAAIDKERERFDAIIQQNTPSQAPGILTQLAESEALTLAGFSLTAQTIFEQHAQKGDETLPSTATSEKKRKAEDRGHRRQLFKFKFCYYCGRSMGVHLVACSRCKEVYYCSKACKLAAWDEFHKHECYVSKGRARASSKKKKGEAKGKDGTDDEEGMKAEDGIDRKREGEDQSLDWSRSTSLSMDLDNYSFN